MLLQLLLPPPDRPSATWADGSWRTLGRLQLVLAAAGAGWARGTRGALKLAVLLLLSEDVGGSPRLPRSTSTWWSPLGLGCCSRGGAMRVLPAHGPLAGGCILSSCPAAFALTGRPPCSRTPTPAAARRPARLGLGRLMGSCPMLGPKLAA